MIESPVVPVAPAAAGEGQSDYRSQVTIGLRGWRQVPDFLRITAGLVTLFQRTPGALRLNLSVAPARKQFTSHSVWRDRQAMETYYRSLEHRESVRRSYGDLADEFYSVSTGGEPRYAQRCPQCHSWTTGTAPKEACPKCNAALPRRLSPQAQVPEDAGPEYGGSSPTITPESDGARVVTGIVGALSPQLADRVYRVLNLTPMLWWATMILAPRWWVTKTLVGSRVPYTGLGLFYLVALLKAIVEKGAPDYGSLEKGPQRLFSSRAGLLAGWAHFLAFDLFAGIWIYRVGLAERRTTRLPLLLTFLGGPLGLLWFLVQRGLGRSLPLPLPLPVD